MSAGAGKAEISIQPTGMRTKTPPEGLLHTVTASSAPAPKPKDMNIASYALSGTYNPDKPIFIDAEKPNRTICKRRAEELVAGLAGVFEPGSTVCLHLPNDILYPVLCLAIWASKCRWTGTNPKYQPPELEHHFRASDTKYVVTGVENLANVRAAVDHSGTGAEIVLFTDILQQQQPSAGLNCFREQFHQSGAVVYRSLHDLQRPSCVDELHRKLMFIDSDSIASLMSTSGTTGRPKMAARSHRAMVAENRATMDNHEAKDYEVRRLYSTPIFHAFSTGEMVINSLRQGVPSYFMHRCDPSFPKKIADFQITETFAPPPMLLSLLNNPGCHTLLRSLRAIYSGGAPLAPELHAQFLGIFPTPPPRIVQVWGMTEGGWFTTFKFPETDETNSCGRALQGLEVMMSAEDRSKLDDGQEIGQLYVRGPGLMSRYFGNPEATAETFRGDGWLRTGDVGYVREGKVYLVDRVKDLIKVNGWQVSPAELEDALLVSEHVKDCGVIGEGQGTDEHPKAFVVLADEAVGKITSAMIKEHLRSRLVSYKVSRTEVRFIDTIPKSASGKILRNELRQLSEQHNKG
ncbi:4-coumarate-- ligase 2 [Lecanosticta acicola]|uniref:4-coumarate-- ligase 2 n=1 Tax=Lecanosticta acicola TaxID=111012 RepID=A0AAI9E7N7_9PEZI|nr:4-coumarate-- ligase 2 [Lecanosticta acicola]